MKSHRQSKQQKACIIDRLVGYLNVSRQLGSEIQPVFMRWKPLPHRNTQRQAKNNQQECQSPNTDNAKITKYRQLCTGNVVDEIKIVWSSHPNKSHKHRIQTQIRKKWYVPRLPLNKKNGLKSATWFKVSSSDSHFWFKALPEQLLCSKSTRVIGFEFDLKRLVFCFFSRVETYKEYSQLITQATESTNGGGGRRGAVRTYFESNCKNSLTSSASHEETSLKPLRMATRFYTVFPHAWCIVDLRYCVRNNGMSSAKMSLQHGITPGGSGEQESRRWHHLKSMW